MSAASDLRAHLLAALAALDVLVAEKVTSDEEHRDLILRFNELSVQKLRDKE